MLALQNTVAKSVTRNQWLRILSANRQYYWPPRHPRERRKQRRDRIPALATLTFPSACGGRGQTVYVRRPVLNASEDGLTIHTQQRIAPDTVLSIEMGVGDKRFLLRGKVTHCTGLPGSMKIGVALLFAPNGNRAEKPGR